MGRQIQLTQLLYILTSLFTCLGKRKTKCPNCDTYSRKVVDRKWIVTTLRRCPKCCLLYRAPTTSAKQQSAFYQKQYSQGFTTDLPSEDELKNLIQKGFVGTERDYSRYLELFSGLNIKQGSLILEYGCSWGYGAWQLKKAGFEVTAFEISRPRCEFAREKLGVNAVSNMSEIQGLFDVTFSAHVLEHVDNVKASLDTQMTLLRPGGWLVGITPNGSLSYREKNFTNFHRLWGLVHPQLLDDVFLQKKYSGMNLRLGSISGEEGIGEFLGNGSQNPKLHRWELLFAVRKLSQSPH